MGNHIKRIKRKTNALNEKRSNETIDLLVINTTPERSMVSILARKAVKPSPMKRKLTQFLATPSKVVSALNWRDVDGSILSLDLITNKKSIGIALAPHPS